MRFCPPTRCTAQLLIQAHIQMHYIIKGCTISTEKKCCFANEWPFTLPMCQDDARYDGASANVT